MNLTSYFLMTLIYVGAISAKQLKQMKLIREREVIDHLDAPQISVCLYLTLVSQQWNGTITFYFNSCKHSAFGSIHNP